MAQQQARIGLIIIGDEILSGRRADQHLPRVIELLSAHDLALDWAQYLPDVPAQITAELRRVFAGSDIVFCTGGIGATPDDHTRQCAAAALGVALELHPQAREQIQQRIRRTAQERGEAVQLQRADNLQRLKMGEFPVGAGILPNPYNQIPGFHCTGPGGARVYFTPGFPVMAWPMIEWAMERELQHGLRGRAWSEHSIFVLETPESLLTPVMEAVEAGHPKIQVFSLPSVDHPRWGHCIDLGVKGPPAAVEAAWADLLARLRPMNLKYGDERRRP